MSKEIPILFDGDMVRAILGGDKTQTRRPGKFVPNTNEVLLKKSPFGKAGDVLWVRETFCEGYTDGGGDAAIYYKASDGDGRFKERISARCGSSNPVNPKWTPSIHMPKWACRTKLRVKRVWIERVQEMDDRQGGKEGMMYYSGMTKYCDSCRMMFQHYWDNIYGTWSENPWVWACEFEVI